MNKVSYGITTGFGKFSDVAISKEECRQLTKKFNYVVIHVVWEIL